MGTDITAGREGQVTKLKERQNAAAKKAGRVNDLVRIDGRCKKLGMAGVNPQQNYGVSIVRPTKATLADRREVWQLPPGKACKQAPRTQLQLQGRTAKAHSRM